MARRKGNGQRHILQALGLALLAFILSFALNASFEELAQNISFYLSIPLFFFVIMLGIAGDGIGIASTRADEKALLSMASRNVKGAKESLWFVRNASKVSSVFNDVLGDVSATLSGALAVAIIYRIRFVFPWLNVLWLTSIGVGLVSALGVGGKALFKPVALRRSEGIVLFLGKIRRVFLRVFRRK